MKELLGLIAVFLAIIGYSSYFLSIFRNRIRPHLFSWIIWSITTALVFLGQFQKGGGAGSWTTATTGLITILIAVIALKNGTKNITKLDAVFFTGALLAIVPWLLTKDPTASIVILTLIDVCGFIPTIRKTLRDSNSETLTLYTINIFRHGLAMVALANYNVATYLYPMTMLIANGIMVYIIKKPKFNK